MLIDIMGNEILVGAEVFYSMGSGIISVGTVNEIAKGKTLPSPRGSTYGGPAFIIISGHKLKLSGHKRIDSTGRCTIDRVVCIKN